MKRQHQRCYTTTGQLEQSQKKLIKTTKKKSILNLRTINCGDYLCVYWLKSLPKTIHTPIGLNNIGSNWFMNFNIYCTIHHYLEANYLNSAIPSYVRTVYILINTHYKNDCPITITWWYRIWHKFLMTVNHFTFCNYMWFIVTFTITAICSFMVFGHFFFLCFLLLLVHQ